jgi:hypothetical protein
MGIKSLFVVAVLLFASVAVMTGPTVRRAAAQDQVAAAVVSGSCDNLGDVAADLRALSTPSDGGVQTSFSTVDLAIDELSGGAYSIVVGDPGSPSACGEIAGSGNDLYVAVPAQNGSGLSGIAWLHARDTGTQISLFIAEGLGGSPAPAPATETPGPPPPPEETATPAPANTPKATRTPRPSRTPTKEATGQTTTYEAPTYHYKVTYDSKLWQPDPKNPDGETIQTQGGPRDYLSLNNGQSMAEFISIPAEEGVTANDCLTYWQQVFGQNTQLSDINTRVDDSGNPIQGGDDANAFIALDLTFTNADGKTFPNTFFVECWQMPGSGAVLSMLFQCSQRAYDQQVPAREGLVQGVELPS